MKELTIEEKAKRYDEAIKVAQSSLTYPDYPGFIRADVVFPELTESEDERIKKRIIQALHGDVLDMEETNKALAWLEKQGNEKSADKIEPKFHKGDWVIINGHVLKITEIRNDLYETIFQNDELRVFDISIIDNAAHLWTIQDAKDGDVLACDGQFRPEIGIVKKYLGKYGGCDAYCFVDWDGIFRTGGFVGIRNIHPATKEQRDLLFQKMKEEGYEWDKETKELKKIN